VIDLLDYEIFSRTVRAGSLSAAGRELGLSPSVVSKRLARLEERLGERLLQRTTRRMTPTEAGRAFYERVQVILSAVEETEAFITGRSVVAQGVLKVSAPASFSRLHIAPRLKAFLDANPGIHLDFHLSDDLVDLVGQGFDLAVRIGVLADSSLVARRLAPNRRILCAAPSYLAEHGEPQSLEQLNKHRLVAAANNIHWRMQGPQGPVSVKAQSVLKTNSSEVVREVVLSGLGVGFRSTWDVAEELRQGRLQRILPQYEGLAEVGIFAVFPTRELVPSKVRAFVDYLVELFGPEPYWDRDI
jgi:DNA-binding transcriptional LysR family regulator